MEGGEWGVWVTSASVLQRIVARKIVYKRFSFRAFTVRFHLPPCSPKGNSCQYEQALCNWGHVTKFFLEMVYIMGYSLKNASDRKSITKIPKWPSLMPLALKSTPIAGFHMTSLKFKLQNYWSCWYFTLMRYKSSWKLISIQILFRMGSWFCDRLRLNFQAFAFT